ncbi:MAG: protein kinase domain-containing protein [Dehalococcoidia bacterium]
MPSERVQRQIDRLLDQAEEAMAAGEWETVRLRCEAVLTLDAGNPDAMSYRDGAVRRLNPDAAGATTGSNDGGPARRHAAAGALSAPPLPESFTGGRYRVSSLLGEGGKKIVYRARDTVLKREVAFALIKTDGLDAAGRERVQREAEVLAQLGAHPNIVTVHDLGQEHGQPYIVTELLSGGDLQQLVADTPEHRLPITRVLEIGLALAKALAFAHEQGVVHRDLKPGNVWLAQDGTPKLGDFGLAVASDQSRLTQVGMMVGTAAYIAPEQAMGQAVTPRSDLYALGCVLYELVTGRPPFVGDESVALIGQHLNAIPVSPTWHRPDCPRALDALILRLLEKDPSKRPASAQAVAESLAGISPSAKRHTSESRQQGTTPSGTNPVYRRTFVGREAELRQLEAAFDAASGGQGGLVLVMGEPGIGKTTLTEQLATYASLRGGRTLVGHCYEEGSLSLPYLPFVETMRSYVLSRAPEQLQAELGKAAPDVARLVSEVRDRVAVEPAPTAGDTGEERYRLLQGVSTFLRNAATAQPLVLVLEDLHDADRGTLDLLQHLARQLRGARLLLVGTYRDVEVDRAHPLSATLAELQRGASFVRVRLRGLTADEVQRMLAAIAGQEIPWGLAEVVHRQTEGNPLFVQEVIRYLAESGLVTRQDGRWQTPSAESLLTSIPEGLRDVIGRRLSRLSEPCNRLLSVAAVIGREFQLLTLVTVSGDIEDRLVDLLDEAVKVAVLQEHAKTGQVQYRFAHAFFRQTLYEELSAPRQIRLHHQIARALEQQYAGRLPEHAAELADHFAHSSDPEDLAKAVQYGVLAAQRARAVFAYGEAVRLLEQALEVQAILDPDDAAQRCDLLMALVEVLPMVGEALRAAEAVAPEAFALAERLGDRTRAARISHLAHAAFTSFGAGSARVRPDFRRWRDRLVAYAAPGTREEVQAKSILALDLLWGTAAERQQAAGLHRETLALARTLGDPEAQYQAAFTVLNVPIHAEQALALSLAEEFAGPAPDGIPTRLAEVTIGFAGRTLLVWGRRAQAEAAFREAEALAARANDAYSRLFVHTITLSMPYLDGRLEASLAATDTLLELGAALGMPLNALHFQLTTRVGTLMALGRYADALSALAGYFAEVPRSAAPPAYVLAEAYTLAQFGNLEAARAALLAFHEAVGQPDANTGTGALGLYLETAMLLRDRDLVTGLVPIFSSAAALSMTGHIGASTCPARLLGDAMAFLGEREPARAYYEQALVTAGKIGFRPEIALAQLGLAELLGEGDQSEQHEAQAHLAFVIRECEAMGMAPALARARALHAQFEPSPAPPSDPAPGLPAASAPQPAGVGQVFISYSSDDRAAAMSLAEHLKGHEIPVWLDKRNIAAGASWDEQIVRGIKASAVVAVLYSPAAMQSRNVQQELRLAMQYDKALLPLLLAPTEFPEGVEYVLAGRQWVEVLDHAEDQWLPQVLAAVRRLT